MEQFLVSIQHLYGTCERVQLFRISFLALVRIVYIVAGDIKLP
jgi:hypothetical protein